MGVAMVIQREPLRLCCLGIKRGKGISLKSIHGGGCAIGCLINLEDIIDKRKDPRAVFCKDDLKEDRIDSFVINNADYIKSPVFHYSCPFSKPNVALFLFETMSHYATGGNPTLLVCFKQNGKYYKCNWYNHYKTEELKDCKTLQTEIYSWEFFKKHIAFRANTMEMHIDSNGFVSVNQRMPTSGEKVIECSGNIRFTMASRGMLGGLLINLAYLHKSSPFCELLLLLTMQKSIQQDGQLVPIMVYEGYGNKLYPLDSSNVKKLFPGVNLTPALEAQLKVQFNLVGEFKKHYCFNNKPNVVVSSNAMYGVTNNNYSKEDRVKNSELKLNKLIESKVTLFVVALKGLSCITESEYNTEAIIDDLEQYGVVVSNSELMSDYQEDIISLYNKHHDYVITNNKHQVKLACDNIIDYLKCHQERADMV